MYVLYFFLEVPGTDKFCAVPVFTSVLEEKTYRENFRPLLFHSGDFWWSSRHIRSTLSHSGRFQVLSIQF